MDMASIEPLLNPAEATVKVPGSKSYSLRALLIAALCEEEVKINNLLESDDTRAMQSCLESLKSQRTDIDVKDSGLTARFITALACITPGEQTIDGSTSSQKRPIKDLVDGLRELGADIEYIAKEGFLPLKVTSSGLSGRKISLKGDISSQYLSALLLIAPGLKNGLLIEIDGMQISRPYIDMTIDIMDYFGVKVKNADYQSYSVKAQAYQPKDYAVEGDYSSAAYFYAINALTDSKIKVEGLNSDSKQADKKFVDFIKEAGGSLKPIDIDMKDCPDQAMTMAVLAAFADGTSIINGIASLRVKETERVAALENELAKMGIKTSSTNDSLTIYGGKPSGARIDTYGDHRIAMSFAVAATKIPGLKIMNPKVVDKTFPDFWKELAKITNVQTTENNFSNILLIGMRGSGKTTVGKLLAERLGKKFIDMDIYLEEKHDKKVRDIVLENGWEHFRKVEAEACKVLSHEKNCVISSGGGIVLDQANMQLFRQDSTFILLKADPAILSSRIRTDKNRPELSTQPTLLGELDQVWDKRKDKYYKNSDFIVDTSGDSPKSIVNEIMDKLGLK